MTEILTCPECDTQFARKTKRSVYCSRKCYEKAYYRHPDDTRFTPRDRTCRLCGTPFVQHKRNQEYCSTECQQKAWPVFNRAKHNTMQRAKRAADLDKFRKNDFRYYRSHRERYAVSKPWHYLLKGRMHDAKVRGIEFSLTEEWAAERWTGRCEVTGIVFQKNTKGGPHPFSPSVDRIDQRFGYLPWNSRFVLWGVNALRGVGNDDDMYRIAEAIFLQRHFIQGHQLESVPLLPTTLKSQPLAG